jgi:hypothetical protein
MIEGFDESSMLILLMKMKGMIILLLKVVDYTNSFCWCIYSIEEDHLDYIRATQNDIRMKVYKGIHEVILLGYVRENVTETLSFPPF